MKRTAVITGALSSALAGAVIGGAPAAHADATCGGVKPCGIVYNRSSSTLELARDSSSHLTCQPGSLRRNLPPGRNSNSYGSPHWPDVDCFRSKNHWIFTNGRPYPPGTWIRVWTSKWVYNV
ncbi:hypothetical protein [Actinoallomurus sp. CA-150999]|uniref:hypothetical protein n=1 Tax=Actinoallomurus sp. CA-150999 TaxID=3239887 RepID=UPI003D947A65